MPAGRPKSRSGAYERVTLEMRSDLLAFVDRQKVSRREFIESLIKKEMEHNMAGRPTKEMRIRRTLDTYLESDDFKEGVIASTRASWGGSGYSVELFEKGTWRNLWNSQIGNLYQSEGIILRLPTLYTDDMQQYVDDEVGSEDEFLSEAFENEREEIAQVMRGTIKEKNS